MRKSKESRCMVPGCGRAAKTRGLCRSCYSTAARLVKEERTTWAKLERAGKCAQSSRRTGTVAFFTAG